MPEKYEVDAFRARVKNTNMENVVIFDNSSFTLGVEFEGMQSTLLSCILF